jgi:RAB protein geranylgeranyltransferase component A
MFSEKFVRITDRYEPLKELWTDGVFISNSFDATSHFESETENVLSFYKQITGKDLDLTNYLKTPMIDSDVVTSNLINIKSY